MNDNDKRLRDLLTRCQKLAAEYRKKFPGLKPIDEMPVLYPGDVIGKRKDGETQITRVQELN